MILMPLLFFQNKQIGQDDLRNPIFEMVEVGKSEGRFSSWTAEEIALDNREVTKYHRKILTPATNTQLEFIQKVYFEGKFHSIKEIKGDDFQRWRLIIVERFGSDKL